MRVLCIMGAHNDDQWIISTTMQELGMRAPEGLDAAAIAEKAGPDLLVPTINVETQESGLRMTLRQWADYFAQPPGSCPAGRICRYPLLNVVSLSLAGTPLQVESGVYLTSLPVLDVVWHGSLHRHFWAGT